MKTYKVYLHTVSKDLTGYPYDKYYIGITNRNNVEERWGKDGSGYKNQIFWNAIQKYGWENIWHEVLYEGLAKEEAKEKEKELIKKYDSLAGKRGYNISVGGETAGDNRKDMRPIYCVELKQAFRSSIDLAEYLNIDNEKIYVKARNYNNSLKNKREYKPRKDKRYTFCFLEDMYSTSKHKVRAGSKPLVDVNTGKLYYNISHARKSENFPYAIKHRLTIEEYNKLIKKERLHKTTKLMLAEDYLKIFKNTMKNDKL